jgi:GNAT superfamily N-acetyltransferase
MQYRAQHAEWKAAYQQLSDLVLCLESGEVAGRLLLTSELQSIRCVHLAVFPRFRRRGIGTFALQHAQAVAVRARLPLMLRVARWNPAIRLYQQLGFQQVWTDPVAIEMSWLGVCA